jgi:hypothetical protein
MGVVCEDRIVPIGDRKIKTGERTKYQDKIIPVKKYENLVIAAAGLVDFREKLIQDIRNLPLLLKEGIVKEDPSRGFVGLMGDIAYRMYLTYQPRQDTFEGGYYESQAIQAFVCYKPKKKMPSLYLIDSVGISHKVRDYEVLGTGEQYAHMFIKPCFTENALMDWIAAIGAFIIRLIDEYQIDETIGIEKGGSVQVWKFPNSSDPYEVKGSELERIMREAGDRLNKFANFLILGRTKA